MSLFRSPVFIICLVLFAIHQVLQLGFKVNISWMDNYLDNLVAMPILLTFLLFERRWLFKKGNDYKLPLLDVIIATLYIILIAELLFPRLSNRFTGDWMDVVFYVAGAVLFYVTINNISAKTEENTKT